MKNKNKIASKAKTLLTNAAALEAWKSNNGGWIEGLVTNAIESYFAPAAADEDPISDWTDEMVDSTNKLWNMDYMHRNCENFR